MAGGAATTAGVRFQDNVASWFAVLILAEADASPSASRCGFSPNKEGLAAFGLVDQTLHHPQHQVLWTKQPTEQSR